MRSSLLIVAFFLAGLLCGWTELLPESLVTEERSVVLLYALMSCVGVSLGLDPWLWESFMALRPSTLLLPAGTAAGSFLGALLVSCFVAYPLSHCLAVASGFAYYSLSSVLISQAVGSELGTVALIANVLREVMTLLLVPLAARVLSPPAVISMGGATTMDTTLPIMAKTLGPRWAFVSVLHAVVLDFSVPFWVLLFCSL